MANQTTVPHLVLERFPHVARAIEIPEDIKGNLELEHEFLFPLIMRDYRSEWSIICDEVDKAIEDGSAYFDSASGIITQVH
tara:strand:- start:1205 stop:1447 length:243 start_codon:yes stop_codon:yes gene_type:complete